MIEEALSPLLMHIQQIFLTNGALPSYVVISAMFVLMFRLISRQAAYRLDSGDSHKTWLARLPTLLCKNVD